MTLLLTLLACTISVIAYYQYYADLKSTTVKPNRYSWLIWSLSMSLETLTYNFVSGDIIKSLCFIISTFACIIITVKIWQGSDNKKPDAIEQISLAICLFGLFSWALFQSAWIAHIILLISIPVGFIPVYKAALTDYRSENSKAWYLWMSSDLIVLGIIAGRMQSNHELPFIITELTCHIFVVCIVLFGKMRSSNTEYHPGYKVELNHLGKAVYPTKAFSKGDIILKFGGTLFHEGEIREKLGGADDHYLQVDEELFLGPSGNADDYVNHSCNPNTGLVFSGNNVYLVAIKNFSSKTEITFDYSTSSHNTTWEMPCCCNDPMCRKTIRGFEQLDKKTQKKYLDLDIVAPYIKQGLEEKHTRENLEYISPVPSINSSFLLRWKPEIIRQKKLASFLLTLIFSTYLIGL